MTKLAFLALWLLVFTIPWQSAIVIPEFGTLTRAVGALLVVFTILSVATVGRLRPLSVIQAMMTTFIVWAVVTSAWTIDPVASTERVLTYLQLLVMVWAMWQLLPAVERQQGLIKAFVLGSTVPAMMVIWARLTGPATSDNRYHAVNMNTNELGYIFALALAMTCYLAATERKTLLFWCYTGLMGIFQVGVLLTASRGAFVASLAAWMFLPWVFSRLKTYKKTAAIVLAGAIVVSVLAVVPASTWARLAETTQEIESGSFSRRGHIWQAGWEVFQRHPFVGVGAGAFQASVEGVVRGRTRSPHSVFLSVGVELGLVGLALLVGVLVSLVLGCMQLQRFDRRLGLILLLVWGMSAVISNYEYHKTTWFVFGLIAAQVGSRLRLGIPVRNRSAEISRSGYDFEIGPPNYETLPSRR